MKNIIVRPTLSAKGIIRFTALLLVACMLPFCALTEDIPETDERGWVDFLLICNEGMSNSGGNVGNTLMAVSLNPKTGKIRLMMMTWDTFVQYRGYDVPQKIDMPYRNNGPEETVRVFNDNFNMDIQLFMSLNYLNLSDLIDSYGGVNVDISRAERNALNGMVASKKENIISQVELGLLGQWYLEKLASEVILNDYGPDTHLNGLQAVGYGWLQYDSVYNCCLREVRVIANLFSSVGKKIGEKVVLYTDSSGYPESVNSRRAINLDNLTEDDYSFLRTEMAPIFQMAYHNLSEDNIRDISLALIRAAYLASRQGIKVLDSLETAVFPLEAMEPYTIIAGTKGHLIDYKANEEAMKAFLFAEEE